MYGTSTAHKRPLRLTKKVSPSFRSQRELINTVVSDYTPLWLVIWGPWKIRDFPKACQEVCTKFCLVLPRLMESCTSNSQVTVQQKTIRYTSVCPFQREITNTNPCTAGFHGPNNGYWPPKLNWSRSKKFNMSLLNSFKQCKFNEEAIWKVGQWYTTLKQRNESLSEQQEQIWNTTKQGIGS